jgi:hypothetical protein
MRSRFPVLFLITAIFSACGDDSPKSPTSPAKPAQEPQLLGAASSRAAGIVTAQGRFIAYSPSSRTFPISL